MKSCNKKNSRAKGKLASREKDELKNKYITARLTTADRGLVDEAVKEEQTTVTEFVNSATIQKAKRVIIEKQKKELDASIKYPDDSKLYVGKYIDNIHSIKKKSELYGGLAGSVILLAIIAKQLKR